MDVVPDSYRLKTTLSSTNLYQDPGIATVFSAILAEYTNLIMEPATNNDADIMNTNEKQDVLLALLTDLMAVVEKGDFDAIEDKINCFHKDLSCHKDLLAELYGNGRNCVTQTDLIICACLHKQADVLYYLLNETDILDHLSDASFDVHLVDEKRVTALRYAICSDDFRMVEALYDYWCGDQHWSGHDINKIERIGRLLEDACSGLVKPLNVHCLIKFNNFQYNLYKYLNDLKSKLSKRTNDGKAMGIMILKLLRKYDYYSNLNEVRLPVSDPIKENNLQEKLKDKSSMYRRKLLHVMYEVYFRKLDFNVALLILEDLDSIRRHLKKRLNQTEDFFTANRYIRFDYEHAAKIYDEIECSVYHFIYRTSEDWRLYLPRDRQLTIKKNRVGIYDGQLITNLTLTYDDQKIYKAPVLYLERNNFKKSLENLKEILIKHVIKRTPAVIESYLLQQKSLKQNNKCGQQKKKHKTQNVNIKLVDDNYLKTNIYMMDHYSLWKIIHYIKAIEKSNKINVPMIERALQVIGEMLKSTEDSYHLFETTKALLQTTLSVETINHIYNIRKYLSQVANGQLITRINIGTNQAQIYDKIKEDLKKVVQYIYPICDMYKEILDKSLLEKGISLLDERIDELPDEAKQYKDVMYERFNRQGHNYETKFMEEVWVHTGHSEELLKEIPYILYNRKELEKRKQEKTTQIDIKFANILPKCIENIKGTLALITLNNEKVEKINDLIIQKKMDPYSVPVYYDKQKLQEMSRALHKLMKKHNDTDQDLPDALKELKDISKHWDSVRYIIQFLVDMDFKMFDKIDFNVVNKGSSPDTQTIDNVRKLLVDIETALSIGNTIHPQRYAFDAIKELDENIFIIQDNDPDTLISCLIIRIDELRKILEYPKHTLNQFLLSYKRDWEFRIVLEMLMADIANILAQCRIKLMYKSGKLLTGIDIGNVLDHGNPFIEVIGDTLDCKDFPTELYEKAKMLAEDRDIISDIYDLYNISNTKDRKTIQQSYQGVVDEKFKQYLKLIPYK